MRFEWDNAKNQQNNAKHGISFEEAITAFDDPKRVILRDIKHSNAEARYFCFAMVQNDVITVRYTIRRDKIRIIGAAYWRDGRKVYEKTNRL